MKGVRTARRGAVKGIRTARRGAVKGIRTAQRYAVIKIQIQRRHVIDKRLEVRDGQFQVLWGDRYGSREVWSRNVLKRRCGNGG